MAVYTGKAIVVTGASQGIGKALCLALAPQRPRLVLAARDGARLEEVAAACRSAGAEALTVSTDVTSNEECRRLIERTVETFGAVDVLVNNAGVGMMARFDEVQDLSIYERLMRVNYLGCIFPTHYALPHLKKSRGQIVVMSSLAGLTGVPTRTGYAASKHAVFGFFDSLRIELDEYGVSVTIVAPYFVLSEIHRRSSGPDGQALGKSPMQEDKIMTAEECAALSVAGMEKRERLVVTNWRGGRLSRLLRIFAPGVVDRLARKAIREGK
ncbi:MAG TPA: SDR family oxidoreductase [Vicinamibacteria bacterium]|nr:SDR family oxidoreductase [Vicinamibacteria bacterium]